MGDRYPCPCCGYKTLALEPPGTYLICPLCFWEDDGEGHDTGSNQVSLRQAQRNFMAFGACERLWLSDVRPPTAEDVHDSNWQTIDQYMEKTRLELIEKIAVAFKDVILEDGISLHQARAKDAYDDEEEARQIDGHMRWQELPNEWLERQPYLGYMDAKGFRHVIPAYLLWCLSVGVSYKPQNYDSFYVTYKCLKEMDEKFIYWSQDKFALLDQTQKQIIYEGLDFFDRLKSNGTEIRR